MGARHFFCVEPPVISRCERESQLFVLEIIFPHIHIVAVAGNIVERRTFEFLFFLCEFPADITALCQLFFNLCQIVFGPGNVQRVADRFQIGDFVPGLYDQMRERFISPLHLIIFFKIAFCIFQRRLCWIQWNPDHFIRVVVQRLYLFSLRFRLIAVSL